MITRNTFKDNVDIIYDEDNTKVTNSFLLDDDEIEKVASEIEFSRTCKYNWRCTCIRNEKSYIREIKAHNNLYRLGLFKSHTIDTDLNENQNIFEKIAYFIIGR